MRVREVEMGVGKSGSGNPVSIHLSPLFCVNTRKRLQVICNRLVNFRPRTRILMEIM